MVGMIAIYFFKFEDVLVMPCVYTIYLPILINGHFLVIYRSLTMAKAGNCRIHLLTVGMASSSSISIWSYLTEVLMYL